MKRTKALYTGFICALTLLSTPAFTQIAPDGVQRYFRAGERPIQNVKVNNNYTNKDFNVQVKVQREFNKNTPEFYMEDTKDFLMAPSTFPLRASESRLLRLVYTKPLDQSEKVYRVTFHPQPLRAEDAGDGNSVDMGVSILKSTGMLVLVSPKTPAPRFKWERNNDGITIMNEGNVSLDFMRVKEHCPTPAAEDCIELEAGRVYPGQSRTFAYPGHLDIKEWYYKIYDKIQSPISIGAFSS